MSDYRYIIVGGGMAADSAVKGIRDFDETGKIAVFSAEKDMPYNRPPLSKGLWKGEDPKSIWRKTEQYNVDLFTANTVVSVKPESKSITSAAGKDYTYDKLLLATGGSVRRLAFGGEDVIYFRTYEDYSRLRSIAEHASEFVVIGGGFIGSEIAAALTMNGKKVSMILPENGIGAKVFPKGLSSHLVSYFSDKGVAAYTKDSVIGIERESSNFSVKLKSGKKITADGIIAGIGIVSNDELAKSAGLAVDNGIIVDAFLRTTNHDIYAAGDAANFYSIALDKRIRVEHEDNANAMGIIAGHNMAGKQEAYNYLPFFYSDLFDLGYEAVGELDSRMEVVEDWVEEFRKGVVYYLSAQNIRGVLLWNTWGKVDDARKLIGSERRWSRGELQGLIRD